jgi:hypothetical protein
MRELINQIGGCLENRLTQYQTVLETSLPSSIELESGLAHVVPRNAVLWVFPFRTLLGEVTVFIKGDVDDSMLRYSAAIPFTGEGRIILF